MPEYGALTDHQGRVISKFTQKQLAAGDVFYQSNSKQPEWTVVDFFTFSVRAGPSKPVHQKSFYVQISYDLGKV